MNKNSVVVGTKLKLYAWLLAVAWIILTAGKVAAAREVTLEDNSLRVAFDSQSGALTRLENKETHWVIERRPKLGMAFRLFAPLPERRWNPVMVGNNTSDYAALFGASSVRKQPAAEIKKISGHEIRIQWKNPVSENGGALPMTLTADVTLTNGVLTFNATLQNDSALTVETIDYPYFGDLTPPARDTTMTVRLLRNGKPGNFISDEIYPHFSNRKGYWGVFWPTKIMDSGQSPFCLIQAPGEGLDVQLGGGKSPYRVQYVFEQHPGVLSSINNLVPPQDEIDGAPVHLEFRTCHFLFLKPHSTMNLTPVIVRGYQGDWHSGVSLNKP